MLMLFMFSSSIWRWIYVYTVMLKISLFVTFTKLHTTSASSNSTAKSKEIHMENTIAKSISTITHLHRRSFWSESTVTMCGIFSCVLIKFTNIVTIFRRRVYLFSSRHVCIARWWLKYNCSPEHCFWSLCVIAININVINVEVKITWSLLIYRLQTGIKRL